MADKKPDQPDQPDEDTILVKRVDKMMNIKQPESETSRAADSKTNVSEMAASVNEALAQNLSSAPELPPEMRPPEEPKPAVGSEPIVRPDEVPKPTTEFDDSVTDKAVDDIAANESDMVLAVEDAKAARQNKSANSGGWKDKLRRLARSRKTWLVAAVLLLVIFAVPLTRYKVLGLVVKKSVTITVVDSNNATPVSNAQVELAGDSVKTDANGKAKLRAGLGKHDLAVTKRYYKNLKISYFVGFKSAPESSVKFVATGRLVPIIVLNKITGKPVSGVQVQILGTTAKTNAKGQTIIALPTTAKTNKAKLSLKGYNGADVTIVVTDKAIKANSFELTPAGQIYFLSNRSGNLDVVKSNLDGSGRKTVLAGTGKEDRKATSLMASRDWRYLVLKTRRDGALASLYLIDTSNDKITQFDNSDADFSLVGWYDHNFIYSLTRNNLQYWQPGRQLLKSYDAEHQQLNQLDQNQAVGDSTSYAYQNFFSFYIVNGVVVYNAEWREEGVNSGSLDMSDKNDTIRGVQPNGQNKKDYQSFASTNTNYMQATLYKPQAIYYAVYDSSAKPTYYTFENQAVKTVAISQDSVDQSYPTFLLSPAGKQTLWAELRDGKNALFIGDDNAQSKKQIASLSVYSPYGWYSDNYVLLSKNNSELYVTTPGTLAGGRQPLKITDYAN